eukprot:536556-Rhodomonas_salina.1
MEEDEGWRMGGGEEGKRGRGEEGKGKRGTGERRGGGRRGGGGRRVKIPGVRRRERPGMTGTEREREKGTERERERKRRQTDRLGRCKRRRRGGGEVGLEGKGNWGEGGGPTFHLTADPVHDFDRAQLRALVRDDLADALCSAAREQETRG